MSPLFFWLVWIGAPAPKSAAQTSVPPKPAVQPASAPASKPAAKPEAKPEPPPQAKPKSFDDELLDDLDFLEFLQMEDEAPWFLE